MKLRLEVELDYDSNMMHGDDLEAIAWFWDEVMLHPGEGEELVLHSSGMGDWTPRRLRLWPF